MKHRYLTLSIASALLLAGCASTPNISLDKAKSGPIATPALLGMRESQQFMVRDLAGLKGLGGAIGGAVAAQTETRRTGIFVDAYNKGPIHLANVLVDDLPRELAAGGMQVSYLPDASAIAKNGVDDYSHIQTDKDALLSVWFGPVGYIADGIIDAPFEPWVVVHVRVLQGKTKKILSQKTYSAGYKPMLEGAVHLPCATTSRFDTFEKLMAEFDKSVAALSECQKAIVVQAAKDLR